MGRVGCYWEDRADKSAAFSSSPLVSIWLLTKFIQIWKKLNVDYVKKY